MGQGGHKVDQPPKLFWEVAKKEETMRRNRKVKLAIVPVAPDKTLALPALAWGTAPLAPISEEKADGLTAVERFARLEFMRANCQNLEDFKRDFILSNQGEVRSFFNKFNNMGKKRPAQVDGKPLIINGEGICNKDQAAKAIWHCTYCYIASLVFPRQADAEAQPQPATDATVTAITVPDHQSTPQPVEDEEEEENEDATSPADATDAEIVTSDVAEVIASDQVAQEDVPPSETETKLTYTASNPPARTDWEATFSRLDDIERMDALKTLLKVMKMDSLLEAVGAALASAGMPNGKPDQQPTTSQPTGGIAQEKMPVQHQKNCDSSGLQAKETLPKDAPLSAEIPPPQREVLTSGLRSPQTIGEGDEKRKRVRRPKSCVYQPVRQGPKVLEVPVSSDRSRLKYYLCVGDQSHPYPTLEEAKAACDTEVQRMKRLENAPVLQPFVPLESAMAA
jgi:hypothetical protein